MPTILIVDVEPSQRYLVRAMLSDDPSHAFFEVSSLSQALPLVQVHHPDAIILDLDGAKSNGLRHQEQAQLARIIQHTPVIFTATWSEANRALMSVFASGRPLLFKPFEAGDLRSVVYHALRYAGLPQVTPTPSEKSRRR